jgi:putative transposase
VSRGELFALIASEKTKYGVRRLCRVLGVSKTAFYDWAARDGGPTTQEVAEAHAAHELHAAWAEHRRVYGARRLTAEIRDRGHDWARKRVARLMSVAGIEGAHRRRRGKRARASDCPAPAPDRVGRQFTVAEPDRLWVGDITYLRSWEGFLYLAVVMDACSRRVVGWAMATHLRRELVLDAVGMAIFTRKPAPGLVHHSDRGQFGSWAFTTRAKQSGLVPSMGSIGDCYDNAVIESFWSRMQVELLDRQRWRTRLELANAMFDYLEVFHNRRRRHSALGWLTPIEFENRTSITVA